MGKALVLCADGCEESEALLVVDILRRAGITTQTYR
jgi:putative intracellular protease/amidase